MPYHEIWKRMDNNLCVHKLVYGGLDMEYIYIYGDNHNMQCIKSFMDRSTCYFINENIGGRHSANQL